ncbi:MAG: type ISP restriction/modification enzyme [Candidatus Hatepunaea meridiana]|nr:type ISP restriction/modification enzyme [Candidatus Hatepunaea meridiana]
MIHTNLYKMPELKKIKPTHRAIKRYYDTIDTLRKQGVTHEGGLRQAFQSLLADTARQLGWTLITELGDRVKGKRIVPDGTIKDRNGLPRGWWEAKDSADNLDTEISKKIGKGYPLGNILFENTIVAVLFQNGSEVMRISLTDPATLANLLNQFYAYTEPNIEGWEKAIVQFKPYIPELAQRLNEIIKEAHQNNPRFNHAFNSFFKLCHISLNPNISRDAVDEMLIQHLLTERVIREVFRDSEFRSRNVIAAEIEKVITALVSHSFSREEFLRKLDRFYIAIENAARTIEDFTEKQYFLSTVYEQFFQGYSVKVADTHGIVYTPQPVVEFMCNSVEKVLKEEFGGELWDPDVVIVDPAVGTGSFIVNLLKAGRVPSRELKRFYKERLFANEVMLLPYYIASLNIEHAYYERTGIYEPFEGLCFVDTLNLKTKEPVGKNAIFRFTEENTQRIERQQKSRITVVIGNPPYNAHQVNENDNNKNRRYPEVEKRLKDTYVKDSKATNKNALWDAYVKFFRWATDRLEQRDGIVCFISNNSFIDAIAFDGMRKHLLQDFTRLYQFDLRGNVRKGQREGNVFDIMVGVGITIAVKSRRHRENKLFHHAIKPGLSREEKLEELMQRRVYNNINWHELHPDKRHTWILPEAADLFGKELPMGRFEARKKVWTDARAIFHLFGNGVKTNRDKIVYDFNRDRLIPRVKQFIEDYNCVMDRWKRIPHEEKPENNNITIFVDDFCEKFKNIDWSESLKANLKREVYGIFEKSIFRNSLYRPFVKMFLYFDAFLNERRYQFPKIFPTLDSERNNIAICSSGIGMMKPFQCLVVNLIPSVDMLEKTQCFPFYTYKEDGSGRLENITDWALGEFRKHYKDDKIGKWDIFYYIYGLLHHPGYRETFKDCLKRDLPRIPFAPDFRAFERAGKELAEWHLNYETVEPYELEWVETPDVLFSYKIEKMKLTKDKKNVIINESLTLKGIPSDVFDYRLGNRSALEWVVDQYRVKTDKRTGIVSDPNNSDDPKYITRLIGQVLRVSLETVKIVNSLPKDWH